MQEVLDDFYEKRLIAACHSQAFRYPVIKKWFLTRYPEVAKFGTVDEANQGGTKVIDLPKEKSQKPTENMGETA
jgi:hypothetical protein